MILPNFLGFSDKVPPELSLEIFPIIQLLLLGGFEMIPAGIIPTIF